MILADSSFWIALSFPHHPFHETARAWFNEQTSEHSVLFCRSTQQSFLRLLTTEAVIRPYGTMPMTNAAAWDFYQSILSDSRCGFVSEPADLNATWEKYTRIKSASPKLWMDAYLAAFAITAGFQLVTIDAGFRQFEGLKAIVLNADGLT